MKEQKLELYFFFLITAAVLALTFFIFLSFLGALAVAAVMAVIFHPLYAWLVRAVKWKGLAAGITTLLILLIVFVPLSFLGFLLLNQAQDVFIDLNTSGSGGFQSSINFIESQVGRLVPGFELDVDAYLKQGLNWVTQSLGGIFAGTAQAILTFFIGVIALYYFLRDGTRFREIFVKYSPLRDTYDNEIVNKIALTIGSILKGSLLVALIQGILSGVGFLLFGVPNAVLWGSVAAIGALIPGIGTAIVLVPAVLYLFFFVGTLPALGLLLWGSLAVGLIDNLLGPTLIGRGMRIHPLLVLLAVLGGLKFFGPVGFLLGPIVLSLLLALAEIYRFFVKHEESHAST